MIDTKYRFLAAVLGDDGARALRKASERHDALGNAVVPRAILSWIGHAARTQYEGSVPGVDNSYISFRKTEDGFSGEIALGEVLYDFEDASLFHVAAAVGVSMGLEQERVEPSLRDLELQRLGKSIDLLVRARAVTNDLLQKKVLDSALGYTFQDEHKPATATANEGWTAAGGMPASTTIHAIAPTGEKIGYATFHHQNDGTLVPFGVYVDDAHQRRGIASHMYRTAEKLTQKRIVPGHVQTDEGKALWQGNAQQGQFGKAEEAGPAHKPTAAAEPIPPDGPTRQQTAQPKLPKVKNKKPPPTPTSIPGLPKLKLSEAQIKAQCPVCDGYQVKQGRFTGCACFRGLAKSVEMTKSEDRYTLEFKSDWDEDSILTLMESMRLRNV